MFTFCASAFWCLPYFSFSISHWLSMQAVLLDATSYHLPSQVATAPPGAQAAQLDFAAAYRQMAVLRAHQVFLAVLTFAGVFVDHFNPFGLSSAAGTLGIATDATVDIVKSLLPIPFFIKWVDDLLPTRTPSSESSPGVYEYAYELSDISRIITSLGWIVNDLKTIDFASIVTYVGFTWDIASKRVSLPEKKRIKHLTKLLNVLSSINASARCHLDPLVNLQGSLSHLCFVYRCGRSRMPALHRFISSFNGNSFIQRFPPPHLLSDLQWWQQTLEDPSFFRPISFRPIIDLDIYVDASTSWGIGLVVGSLWRAWQFLPGWQSHGRHIGWAESIALEFAVLEAAAHHLHDVRVLVHSDNKGSIGQYVNGRSRNPFINESIIRTSIITMNANFDIILDYVESARNPADAASHGVLQDDSLHLPYAFRIPEAISSYIRDV
jgi:hypothetical protein